MTHLTRDERLDACDDTLAAGRTAHLDACAECRDAVAGLRRTLEEVAGVEVPEPSPLFWDRFPGRVRAGLGTVAPRDPVWRGWWHPGAGVLVAAVAIAVVITGGGRRLPVDRTPEGSATTAVRGEARATGANAPPPASSDWPEPPDVDVADDAWAVVAAAADQVAWDETHEAGLSARPGSAERLAQELSEAERRELARLLAEELARSGRSGA